MNGNLKKITAALLALVFLLALLPAEAAAATSGSCGANLRWTLDSSGVLTISGTGDMTNFSLGVEPPWYYMRDQIKTVIIKNGVTGIGSLAFYECSSLTSVTIPSSVTYISSQSFSRCSGLTSVTIPSSVKYINDNAFFGCSGLTNVTIQEGVKSIGNGAFGSCRSLTSITIPGSVTSIGSSAFGSCSSLTRVTIPEGVTSIGDYAFSGCSGLTSVTIPSSTTSIGDYAFSGCSGLTDVYYAGNREQWNAITIYRSNFSSNDSLLSAERHYNSVGEATDISIIIQPEDAYVESAGETISVSVEAKGDGLSYQWYSKDPTASDFEVTTIKAAIYSVVMDASKDGRQVYCVINDAYGNTATTNTVTLAIGSPTVASGSCGANLTWALDTDGVLTVSGTGAMTDYEYKGAPWYDLRASITSVMISEGVSGVGDYAFFDCSVMTDVTISESVTSIGNYTFNNTAFYNNEDNWENEVLYCGKYLIEAKHRLSGEITVKEGTKVIADSAFTNCNDLTSVTIPEGVTSIGTSAFSSCSRLTSVTIPEGVTSIGKYAFYNCSSLTSVTIPSSVTSIGSCAFQNCTGLTSVTISDGVTSIGYSAFYGCSGLTSVTIPSSVTSIGDWAFEGCRGLTGVTISEGVTSIGIGAFQNTAFYNNDDNWDNKVLYCGNYLLEAKGDLYGAYTVKEGTKVIAGSAFNGSGLTSVIIPSGVTSIGDRAFSYLGTLTKMIIPEGVTSIGNHAFEGCAALTSVTIPSSVTSIGADVFLGCSGLTSVTIPEGVTSIGERAFYDCSSLTDVTIPSSVTSIGDYAFYRCRGLTSVTIPEGVTSIGRSTFEECTGLTSVTIPEGVTSIGDYAFSGCYGLTGEIVIPEGVTSIGDRAFSGCNRLTSVTIPESVTSIGDYAFYGCTSLTNVYYCGSYPQWSAISLGSNNDSLLNAKRHYRLTITEQPSDTYVESTGDTTRVSVAAIGDGLTYQWYLKDPTASDFEPSPINTEIYSVVMDASKDGRQVYCVINDAYGNTATTNTVTLTIGASGTCGDNLRWKLDSSSVLTISGTGPMTDYAYNEAPWYDQRALIASVMISNGVTGIGDSAFYRCTGLTGVTIPPSVTSIGCDAFYGCSSLTNVTIPEEVTSIGNQAFYDTAFYNNEDNWENGVLYCGNNLLAAKTDLSGIYTVKEETKVIGDYSFYYCRSLTSMTIPSSVTNIGYAAFYGCIGLTSVTIPSSVTSIGDWAFNGGSGLMDVYYAGNQEQWHAITIYSSNKSLLNADIHYDSDIDSVPGIVASGTCGANLRWKLDSNGAMTIFGTGEITDYGYGAAPWYDRRESITSVMISEGVTNIGDYAFNGCSGLTSLMIPESMTSIGGRAFNGCSNLTDIYYGGSYAQWKAITTGSGNGVLSEALMHFGVIDGSERETVASGSCGDHLTWALDAGGVLTVSGTGEMGNYSSSDAPWYSQRRKVRTVKISEGVTSLGEYAFSGCSRLTDTIIPECVKSIGGHVFDGCSDLTNVTIPESVTSIGSRAFYDTAFYNNEDNWENGVLYCGNNLLAAKTDLSSAYTVKEGTKVIGGSAFYGLGGLTSVTIPSSVTIIESEAFSGCSGLADVYYGGSLEEWQAALTENGNDSLKNTQIHCRVGEDRNIVAYGKCGTRLGWTLDSDGVLTISGTGEINDYGYGATPWYDRRTSITSVIISEGVTGIGSGAFYNCSGLMSVTIPKGVTSIGNYAFYNCSGLTHKYYGGSYAQWKTITTGSGNGDLSESLTRFGVIDGSEQETVASGSCGDSLTWALAADGVFTISGTGEMSYSSSNAPWYSLRRRIGAVKISEGVKSISSYAFSGCSVLTDVSISEGVKSIGDSAFSGTAFYNNEDNWENGVLYCGNYLLAARTDLSGAYTVKEGTKVIADSAFRNCGSLTSVTFPENVTSIGGYAFYGCIGLTGVTISDGLTIIGNFAFYGCSSLTEVAIPASVTIIGDSAFNNCSGLTHIYYGGSYAHWKAIPTGSGNGILSEVLTHFGVIDGSERETVASGVCGEFLVYTLDASGLLTISGTGEMSSSSSTP